MDYDASTQRILSGFEGFDGLLLVAVALGAISTILSTVASLATIYLIESMKKLNGCLRLIKWMTWCQFCYDINFFFTIGHKSISLYCVSVFLSTFGGISVSLWTNVLCIVIVYTIVKFRAIDIMKHFRVISMVVIFPSLVYAILSALMDYYLQEKTFILFSIYDAIRLGSILFNIIACVFVAGTLYKKMSIGSEDLKPVVVLVSRLICYPICQVITRIPASIYEETYGFGNSSVPQKDGSQDQDVAFIFYCLFTPAAGLGYFFVFLLMQPKAYEKLKSLLCGYKFNDAPTTADSALSPSRSSSTMLSIPISNERIGDMDEDELARQMELSYEKSIGIRDTENPLSSISLSPNSLRLNSTFGLGGGDV